MILTVRRQVIAWNQLVVVVKVVTLAKALKAKVHCTFGTVLFRSVAVAVEIGYSIQARNSQS